MAERYIGRGFDEDTGAEWRVEEWTGPGGLSNWRSREAGNRLTRRALSDADFVKIAYQYPDGRTVYRTFTGGVEDVQRVINYWKENDSL